LSAPSSVCTAKARAPMRARSSGMAGAQLRAPEESSRRFWAVAVGVMIEGHAMGDRQRICAARCCACSGDQATTPPGTDSPGCAWLTTATSPTGETSS
jgi:hypothetical protein